MPSVPGAGVIGTGTVVGELVSVVDWLGVVERCGVWATDDAGKVSTTTLLVGVLSALSGDPDGVFWADGDSLAVAGNKLKGATIAKTNHTLYMGRKQRTRWWELGILFRFTGHFHTPKLS